LGKKWDERMKKARFKMLLSKEDKPVYDQIYSQMIAYLKSRGDYDPAVDNVFVDIIARAVIRIRKLDDMADIASAEKMPSFVDAIQKTYKVFDEAIEGLAASRKERLRTKDQWAMESELREAMRELMGLK